MSQQMNYGGVGNPPVEGPGCNQWKIQQTGKVPTMFLRNPSPC